MATRLAYTTPRIWHVVDGRNQIVGRLAPQIARLLQGKHKPVFAAAADVGDYVVVTNARHLAFTGKKMTDKVYKWHTGFFGGLKELTARQMQERDPGRVLVHAVRGMLPNNATRHERLRRLRIVPDEQHPYARQVMESRAYAPAYLSAHAPVSHTPPPKATTGVLVKDYFDKSDPRPLAERLASLKPEDPKVSAAALARRLAAVKGADKA